MLGYKRALNKVLFQRITLPSPHHQNTLYKQASEYFPAELRLKMNSKAKTAGDHQLTEKQGRAC